MTVGSKHNWTDQTLIIPNGAVLVGEAWALKEDGSI